MSNESMLIAILDGIRKYNEMAIRPVEDPTMLALCIRDQITCYLDSKFNEFIENHVKGSLHISNDNALSLIDLWELIVKDT